MSSKRSSIVLPIVGVAAIALVLGLALGSVTFPVTRTTTQISTVYPSSQPTTTVYYDVSTVTIPVPCCAKIPQSFVVGNYLFNVTEYAPLPPVTRNGVVTDFSAGVLVIFDVSHLNEQNHEQANFTWGGTFSETVPNPSNATLFGGDVSLSWFVSSLMLYLTVSTGTSLCGGTSHMTTVSGTTYCTDDVTNDAVVQNPGYAYFLNGSVTFMGVTFQMICPSSFLGCPGTSNVTEKTTVLAGAITLVLTFPDKTTETIGGVIIPMPSNGVTLLSKHVNPTAGIMIARTNSSYQVNLLVQPPTIMKTNSATGVSSCATTYSNGTSGIKLYLPQIAGSSVNLCVRYFSYNPNGTTIHTLDQLTIFAPVQSSGTLKNVNSSFSISASVPEIQIGGQTMANEGFLVTYTIKSTGSAPSGTYEIALSSGLYPDDEICGYGIYNTLQVGNVTDILVGTSCHYIPSPQDNPGLVYSEVVGITNSSS